MDILLSICAIIPGLIISYYIFLVDKYDRESFVPLIFCFCLGMGSTIPAIFLEEHIDFLGFDEGVTLLEAFAFALVGVALIEEVAKFLGVLVYPFHSSFFNEPLDGIVYSVLVAMGFATLENLFYAETYGFETVIVRAFTAVPAHATFGVVMGYFIGSAKFETGGRRAWLLFQGLLFAVVMHGVYDFFILQQVYDGLMGLALISLSLGLYLSRKLIFLHQENSFLEEEEVV